MSIAASATQFEAAKEFQAFAGVEGSMTADEITRESDRLMKLDEVRQVTGLGKTAVYARMRTGTFPRACKVGRLSRWSEQEIQAWVVEQLAARAKT